MRVKEYSVITYPSLGFNYIAIPKTGSSSFKTACYIADNVITEDSIKNQPSTWFRTAKKSLVYVKPDVAIANTLLNISHFRHPVSRTVSLYKDFVFGFKKNTRPKGSKAFIRDFNEARRRQDFRYFVDFFTAHSEEDRNIHFRTQHWFVKDFLNTQTFFFTTEQYAQGIERLRQQGFNLNLYYINKNTAPSTVTINTSGVDDLILQTHETDLKLWEQYSV